MKFTTVSFVIVCCALAVYAALLASTPLRRNSMLRKAGDRVLPAKPRLTKFAVFVLICCPLLILLVLLRSMGTFVDIIMCGVALLGTEMAVREMITAKISGVYSHGLIAEGRLIEFSDIADIPLLQMSKKEQEKHDNGVLELVTGKHGRQQIIYANEEECRRITEAIIEAEPRLKP